MSSARAVAVKALCRLEEGGYSNLVLPAELKNADLSEQDSAFATRVFYGTVERMLTLDYLLAPFLRQPIGKMDAPVRAILRSGLYQSKYMQVPVSAAVNESVRLTRTFRKASAAGMVNAVLRKACSAEPDFASIGDTVQRLSVQYSVGDSIVRLLQTAYGEQTEEILAAMMRQPDTAIRENPLRLSKKEGLAVLNTLGCTVEKGPFWGCWKLKGSARAVTSQPFREGKLFVQGIPSQLAALSVGAKPGNTVIDLCAAPGGKSLLMAGAMENTGTLFSCDVSENRVSLLKNTLQRGNARCARVLQNDASVSNPALPAADCVLADVPCSGLGILAKKPDIRYKKLDELDGLCELQFKILENAAALTKPGGRLVYSTCTILPEENQLQIRRFLQNHPAFRPVMLPTQLPGLVDTGCGWLSLPQLTGLEGFFICAMERMHE